MTARRVWWWLGSVVVAMVGLAGLLLLAAMFAGEGVDRAGDWAGVLSFVLAYLVATVSLLVWMARQAHARGGGPADESVAVRLRRLVRVQWSAEVGTRQLQQPRPLRLRWRPTTSPVAVAGSYPADVAGRRRTRAVRGSLADVDGDTRPPALALVEAFRTGPHRQLMILGEPGAGKTSLAILYILAALDGGRPDDAVPVLLSVAGWNPGERVESWVARRVWEDYPSLTGRGSTALAEVTRLVEDRLVLPVLDGLDEMPPDLLGAAITDLDRAAGAGLRMVLTCRSAEFEQAVTQAGALSHAAVVDIEPVRVADVEVFLTEREVVGSARWKPVLDSMRRDPHGPVASALSTPLMIALARRVYQQPGTDPRRLTEFATTQALERHLLERFLRTIYPAAGQATSAQRWLAFLARHLRDGVRDPNLRWWHLACAVPRSTITTIVAAAGMLVGAITGPAVLTALSDVNDSVVPGVLVGSMTGLSVGMLCGLHGARVAYSGPGRRRGWTAAGSGLWDLGAVAVIVCAIISAATALVLLGLYVAAERRAIELNSLVVTWADALRSERVFTVLGFVIGGLLVVAVTRGLGAGWAGEPRRNAPRLRTLLPSLATGMAVGLVVGLVAELVGQLGLALMGQIRPIYSIEVAGIAMVTGIPVGLGRWLTAPVAERTATSPGSVLRSDRTVLFVAAGVVAAGTAAALTALLWASGALNDGWEVVPGAVFVGTVLVVLCGSGAPWTHYTFARSWLALRGDLPWRLTRFLRQAHTAGVLRQAGPAYQFRHDMLRAHLAEHGPPTRRWASAAQHGSTPHAAIRRRTRSRRLLSAGVALMLLPVTVAFVIPNPLRASLPDPAGSVFLVEFHRDGTLAAASTRGTVRLWDPVTGRLRRTITAYPDDGGNFGLAFSRDGSTLAAGGHNGTVDVWQLTTDRQLHLAMLDSDWTPTMAFSPDGATLASAGSGKSIHLWDPVTGRLRRTLATDTEFVFSLTFSPDGATLASSGHHTVQLWDSHTGQLRRTLTVDNIWYTNNLVFSPEGSMLAASDNDGVVRLWDLATGQLRNTLAAGEGGINSLVFSPDGSTLASGEGDGRIRLWDPATGRLYLSLTADTWSVDTIAFSPDSSILASGGGDGRIRLWHTALLRRHRPR